MIGVVPKTREELRRGIRCLLLPVGRNCVDVEEVTIAVVVRNEGGNVNSNINLTPMVDVMLVLFIILMVVTPLLRPS